MAFCYLHTFMVPSFMLHTKMCFKSFCTVIKEEIHCSSCILSVCHLQVFALGNKTYEHYNAMGKYVDKRLEELGAKRIFDLGLGDDDAK